MLTLSWSAGSVQAQSLSVSAAHSVVQGVADVIRELRGKFDWVICDSPAGIERGATLVHNDFKFDNLMVVKPRMPIGWINYYLKSLYPRHLYLIAGHEYNEARYLEQFNRGGEAAISSPGGGVSSGSSSIGFLKLTKGGRQ